MRKPVTRVIIAGGGTAGWMTAAWFSKVLRDDLEEIILVESEDIGTIGVGEATTPYIQIFNKTLGINEDEFIKFTRGTFKLGIEFVNWGKLGHTYHHAFGKYGREFGSLPFHSVWLRHALENNEPGLEPYSLAALAASHNKFMRPTGANSPLAELAYAYHFDASLYALFLRDFAEKRGVKRVEGKINRVLLKDDGFIEGLVLDGDRRLEADLFIDCTGFRALLLAETLNIGFVDWSHWLPADRAFAVPTQRQGEVAPFTRSTAHTDGWQWRIPLQHRDGNGLVFSSAFADEGQMLDRLCANLPGQRLADPRLLRFATGRREKFWHENCVAVGLSAGFLEPLESTSIMLIQNSIVRLQYLFPDMAFEPADIDTYNRDMVREYEDIRDFLILHYHVGERDDSEFWRHCRHMSIPESLADRLALFKSRGRIPVERNEQFRVPSWFAVMYGQGLRPRAPDPLALSIKTADMNRWLSDTREVIANCCAYMPSHRDFLKNICGGDLE